MSTMTNGRCSPPLTASTSSTTGWTVHDASELYEVPRWSNGYFSVNAEGHVQIHPTKEPSRGIDLKELGERLRWGGPPIPPPRNPPRGCMLRALVDRPQPRATGPPVLPRSPTTLNPRLAAAADRRA